MVTVSFEPIPRCSTNEQTNNQTKNSRHQKGEELEQSEGYLVGNHHRSFKGRVSVVVLHAAAVMEPWEDTGTRHVREEST